MSRPRSHSLVCRLLALALACLITGVTPVRSALDEELQVQAAFLYNFVKFCTWPDDAGGSPLVIGLMGGNPFGTAIDDLRGVVLKGRTIEVRDVRTTEAARGCHLLYVAKPAHSRVTALLAATAGQPMLTVAELPGFARDGGVIEFTVVSDTVKFKVNAAVARRHHLKLSSQLLGVAIEVLN